MALSPSAKTIERVVKAPDWDARVAQIRQIPARHGTNDLPAIYAAVAKEIYVPHLAPDFAYVHWRDEYEPPDFQVAYDHAHAGTNGFVNVDTDYLTHTIGAHPDTLKVFRTIIGLTTQEFAASTALVAIEHDAKALTNSTIKGLEKGNGPTTLERARLCALTIDAVMSGALFPEPTGSLSRKVDKPDTAEGWTTVQRLAAEGVPFAMFLHQRHYGGAFRQLLDATSTQRGDLIEDAIEELFARNGVQFIRTGSHNQAEIEERFEVAVHPAPDFVVFDDADNLRAMLEAKGANDGGTARDKALRFVALKAESQRLGGIPLFAVLSGLGWTRVNDTLGPVVRDTDGRVFTLANLGEMLTCQPFPTLLD